MRNGNRWILLAASSVALIGVLILGILLGGKFFARQNDKDSESVNLPASVRNALADIAVVAEILDGTSGESADADAIRSSLSSMKSAIEQLPETTDFAYTESLRNEIASLLEEAIDIRDSPLENQHTVQNPDSSFVVQSLKTLANARHRKGSQSSNDVDSSEPTNQKALTSSPLLLNMERQVDHLQELLERQLALQQQQILSTEFELDRADIDKLLVAFTTPGLSYTTADGKKENSEASAQPVSLSFLRNYGCLNEDRESLKWLLSAASRVERPRGHLPRQWDGSMAHLESGIADIQRAQQLLIKYGDLMIDRGLLSP